MQSDSKLCRLNRKLISEYSSNLYAKIKISHPSSYGEFFLWSKNGAFNLISFGLLFLLLKLIFFVVVLFFSCFFFCILYAYFHSYVNYEKLTQFLRCFAILSSFLLRFCLSRALSSETAVSIDMKFGGVHCSMVSAEEFSYMQKG